MKKNKNTSAFARSLPRREFMRYAGMGSLLLATSPFSLLGSKPSRFSLPAPGQGAFEPDLEIALQAAPAEVAIYSGRPTRVWRYQAEVLKGPSDAVQNIEGSYLGPIIRAQRGQKVRIRYHNDIPEESIVHFHGLHVPAVMDGHPRYVVSQGEQYVYEFELLNRAGTYWYHPHPHGRTGPQVYQGMAGLFIISDAEEAALPLPRDEFDIPLVLQDRTFDRDNQLVYLSGGRMMGGMMDRMQGFTGDRIFVNGRPDFSLSVATRAYRLRLLNGSNSRVYKLAWDDGSPMVVIGTDGGLLQRPLQRDYVVIGPGQRLELWADFSNKPVGSRITLRSLEFSSALTGGGMGGGMMMGRGMMGRRRRSGSALPVGSDFEVLTVTVDRREQETLTLPARLTAIERHDPRDAVNSEAPRSFTMRMQHMNWTINGRTFEMTAVADDEVVRAGTLEMWQLINSGGGRRRRGMMMGGMGGGMMNMVHPIHLHGEQFQVYSRETAPSLRDDWDSVRHGVIDEGWQDVVLLFPGQNIKILRRFDDFKGLFLYHCHNLEHEDMGMMRNFLVT